jgi:ABC-type antimicrobial peptide transport system permease subunit
MGCLLFPPSKFRDQVRSSLSLWNSITIGAALIACFAGALCIIIVMLVSVSERVVEIGIKKAIGAETSRIMGSSSENLSWFQLQDGLSEAELL